MCKDAVLLDRVVSGETMHSDTPAGLFQIDTTQEHMKGEYMLHLHHKARERGRLGGRERRREKRVFIATNPFLL